jgi:hypothetical protein
VPWTSSVRTALAEEPASRPTWRKAVAGHHVLYPAESFRPTELAFASWPCVHAGMLSTCHQAGRRSGTDQWCRERGDRRRKPGLADLLAGTPVGGIGKPRTLPRSGHRTGPAAYSGSHCRSPGRRPVPRRRFRCRFSLPAAEKFSTTQATRQRSDVAPSGRLPVPVRYPGRSKCTAPRGLAVPRRIRDRPARR